MDHALTVRVQTLLEGVPLPAQKEELLAYARRQAPDLDAIAAVGSLPDREYRFLDEVGEELVHVQPAREQRKPHEPQERSDAVPGGIGDYTSAATADTGRVRDLEQAT